MHRLDKYSVGIVLGLLLPALFCYVYISRFNLWGVLKAFDFSANSVLSKMMMLSVFPNMALLFLFYEMDLWRLAKGVLIGAFPYIIAAIWFTI